MCVRVRACSYVRMCVCVCACERERARARASACVRVRVGVRTQETCAILMTYIHICHVEVICLMYTYTLHAMIIYYLY